MRYVLLIYSNPENDPPEGSPEHQSQWRDYATFAQNAAASGHLQSGEALLPTTMATTVRVRDGKTLITDGPFTETREHLGGFFIVEAEDLDEAIAIAAQVPTASRGSLEIRPLLELNRSETPSDYTQGD